jgi:hypothetical protein
MSDDIAYLDAFYKQVRLCSPIFYCTYDEDILCCFQMNSTNQAKTNHLINLIYER